MNSIQFNGPANVESIELCDQLCASLLQFYNYEQSVEILFAVHEALINATAATIKKYGIEHEHDITFKIHVTEQFFTFTIIDHADGIPHTTVEQMKTNRFEDVLWEESGRGLLIIQSLMDEVSFETMKDGRQAILMRKRREKR